MLTLALMLCASLAGCEKKTTIDIPFDIEDVNNVEMYHYAVPDSAEKKVIAESDDITELYTMFSELEVSNKKSEPAAGGDIVSFRFNLLDDTSYEMIYCAEAVKAGRLKLPKEQVDYFTSADIGEYWDAFIYDVVAADKSELPSYE